MVEISPMPLAPKPAPEMPPSMAVPVPALRTVIVWMSGASAAFSRPS